MRFNDQLLRSEITDKITCPEIIFCSVLHFYAGRFRNVFLLFDLLRRTSHYQTAAAAKLTLRTGRL